MQRSKKTSKLCVTGLCEGNSSVTGEFPTQMASNTETISIWWCQHQMDVLCSPTSYYFNQECWTAVWWKHVLSPAWLLFHKYKPLYLHSFIATHPTNSVQVNSAIKFSENLHIAYSCSVYFYEGRLFFPWLVQKSWLCLLLQDVHSFVLSMFCVS